MLTMGKKSDLNEREALAADISRVEQRLNAGIVGAQSLDGDDITGSGDRGSRALGVANVFTAERGEKFVHFKTPLRTDTHNEMFHFHVTGYSLLASSLIDCFIAGYCYKDNNESIERVAFAGTNAPYDAAGNPLPPVYLSSDGFVVCRIKLPVDAYHTTAVLDAMKVGNGRLFAVDSIDVIVSDQEAI